MEKGSSECFIPGLLQWKDYFESYYGVTDSGTFRIIRLKWKESKNRDKGQPVVNEPLNSRGMMKFSYKEVDLYFVSLPSVPSVHQWADGWTEGSDKEGERESVWVKQRFFVLFIL